MVEYRAVVGQHEQITALARLELLPLAKKCRALQIDTTSDHIQQFAGCVIDRFGYQHNGLARQLALEWTRYHAFPEFHGIDKILPRGEIERADHAPVVHAGNQFPRSIKGDEIEKFLAQGRMIFNKCLHPLRMFIHVRG